MDERLNAQMVEHVESLYGFKILSAEKTRAVWKIFTDQGDFCFKEVNYGPEKFAYVYHAMDHLVKNGFTRMPRVIHTLKGEHSFTYNERIYFVSEWVPGRESDLKNFVDLEMALVALAQMHKASRGLKLPKGLKIKTRCTNWPDRFRSRMADLEEFKQIALKKEKRSAVDQYFLKHVDENIEDCKRALKLLDCPEYYELAERSLAEGVFCHNDYAYHNVMIDDSEPAAYVIDFDYVRSDLRVYDLARMVKRVIKEKRGQKDLLDVVLSTYNSGYPLEKDEYRILAAFLQFPQRFWRISDRYYNRKRKWSDKKYYTRLKHGYRRQKHQKLLVKEILEYEESHH